MWRKWVGDFVCDDNHRNKSSTALPHVFTLTRTVFRFFCNLVLLSVAGDWRMFGARCCCCGGGGVVVVFARFRCDTLMAK